MTKIQKSFEYNSNKTKYTYFTVDLRDAHKLITYLAINNEEYIIKKEKKICGVYFLSFRFLINNATFIS